MRTRRPLCLRLDGADEPSWLRTDLFHGRGLVDFVVIPLCTADGLVSAASFSTTRAQGFTDQERAALIRLMPALRNACELLTQRRVERTLLDTYVGAATARRVMAGRIRRGDLETLEAGLMVCDLRGFTALSNRLPGERVLELLNAYFDCVVPAIGQAGGEVIKFMGDAVLAFFHGESPEASCAAALSGAVAALDGLDRFSAPDAELNTGIALHYGEVGYGNIGSGQRLDFTVIGPDVNLVSRIQSVCSATGAPLLMSERFATLIGPAASVAIGSHSAAGLRRADCALRAVRLHCRPSTGDWRSGTAMSSVADSLPERQRASAATLLVAGIVLATLTEAIAGTALSLGRADIIGDTHTTPDEFAWLDVGYTTLKFIGFMTAAPCSAASAHAACSLRQHSSWAVPALGPRPPTASTCWLPCAPCRDFPAACCWLLDRRRSSWPFRNAVSRCCKRCSPSAPWWRRQASRRRCRAG